MYNCISHIHILQNGIRDLSAEDNSGNDTKPLSQKMLNLPCMNISSQSEQECTDGPVIAEKCSGKLLKQSLPCDSVVVSDKEKKQSKNILQVNPNLFTHMNITDPAKGRKLSYEELKDRMKTFTLPPQWNGPVDYQSMAEAGFVYTGQEDLVYCFNCKIKLDRWSKHMEPLLRHKEESPTCSFVRQKLRAVKGEKGKAISVVAPSKPLNARLTSSIGQLQSSSLVTSKNIHTVVTGLNESRLPYGGSIDDCPGASLPITPENYQSEEERLKSFAGWPLNEVVHPEQLARVGFVYTGEGALVQCFQCGVKYRHWYKGDVPLNVHQRCNPRCPFLQTFVSESKSLLPERQPTRSYIPSESIGSNTQAEEVTLLSLQFPDYSKETIRLQSFKHWGGVLPAQELAEGGFYMIARRDVVRCFSCDVVVREWERSDNVIDEHHKYSPNCSFLKTFLSNKPINSPLSSIDKTGQPFTMNSSLNRSSSIQLPSITDIRLPPSMKSLRSSTSPDVNEDETPIGMRLPPSWGQHRSMSPQGSSNNLPEGSDDSFKSAESHHDTNNDYNILSSIDPPKTKIMVSYSINLNSVEW